MNKWLLTSDGAFFFGQGGITRVENYFEWVDGIKAPNGCSLYAGTTLIAKVDDRYEDLVQQILDISL